MASSVKTKALFLILLLSVNEAFRPARSKPGLSPSFERAEGPQSKPNKENAKNLWHEENAVCKWSGWKCVDPKSHATDSDQKAKCGYRRLPLDKPGSDWCRLTDDFMLETANRARYFQLQAHLLASTSDKFGKNCKGWSSLVNPRCERRAKHMFRAIAFMTRAQGPDHIKEESELFENSLDHMKEVAGKDAGVVMMLKEKMRADKAGLQDPMEHAKKAMGLMHQLLLGSTEEVKQKAREEIKAMPRSTTVNDVAVQAPVPIQARLEVVQDNIGEQVADLEVETSEPSPIAPGQPENNATSVLLQQHSSAVLGKGDLLKFFAGLVVAIIIFFLLFAILKEVVATMLFAVLVLAVWSLAGCLVKSTYDHAPGTSQTLEVLTCTKDVFLFPFKAVGRGLGILPTKKASLLEMSQEGNTTTDYKVA